MERTAAVLTLLTLLLVSPGCRETSPASSRPWRAITPPGGSLSTADFERVEIGRETRPVLGAQPTLPLRWKESQDLSGDLAISTPLPQDLTGLVLVDAWLSAPVPEARGLKLLEMRALGKRARLSAEPQVVPASAGSVSTAISVPSELHGPASLLSVIARPLPAEPIVRFETGSVRVPVAARLRFGFGLEEAAWQPGWPAVELRVRAEGEGPPRNLLTRRIDPVAEPDHRGWLDFSADLAELAGATVRFVFEAEALVDAPGLRVPRSLPVVSQPEVMSTPPGVVDPRRNVILISFDTLRARSVSAYGYGRATTPILDERVARAGALVRQAVAPMPFTPPSHASMLTGLEPCRHGVFNRHAALPAEAPTLAELLHAEGYRTAAFTEDAYVVAAAGFARGFDVYVERRDDEEAAPGFAAETLGDAERWLDTLDTGPFFLFVHTYQVHEPYRPPSRYADLFAGDAGQGANRRFREALRQYDREVRYVDDLMGVFLDRLAARGLEDNTILVVTSDHGEAFGEHWYAAHGLDLHDEAVLVPTLVRAPGLVPPGTVVEEQVGLADLVPTLLDLVGLRPPQELDGRSYAGRLRGDASPFEERTLVLQTVEARNPRYGVRTSRYKFIESKNDDGSGSLYHLESDPDERKNLAETEAESLAEARRIVLDHRETCAARRQAEGFAEAPDTLRRKSGWLENRDQIDEKLRSLGYAE